MGDTEQLPANKFVVILYMNVWCHFLLFFNLDLFFQEVSRKVFLVMSNKRSARSPLFRAKKSFVYFVFSYRVKYDAV